MTPSEIAHLRLINQHISAARFSEPAKVVEWLAAVQAQDYEGAKWSLGLRLRGAKDGDIERAFSEARHTSHPFVAADLAFCLAG